MTNTDNGFISEEAHIASLPADEQAEIAAALVRKLAEPQGQPPFYLGRDEHGADHWTAGPVVWIGGPASGKTTAYVAPSVRAAAMLGDVTVADAKGDAGRWRWLDYEGGAYSAPRPGGLRLLTTAEDQLVDGLSELPHRSLVIDEFTYTVDHLGSRMVPALVRAILNRYPVGLAAMSTGDLPPEVLDAILENATVVVTGRLNPNLNQALVTAGLGLEGYNLRQGQAMMAAMAGAKTWRSISAIGPFNSGSRITYRLPGDREVTLDFSSRKAN